ncbi:MAG: hypothetical protein ABSD20_14525 [Terriglobales bacterium]|jgi:hypothetical protein
MQRIAFHILVLLILLLPGFAQQDQANNTQPQQAPMQATSTSNPATPAPKLPIVNRWDFFTGYTYLSSTNIGVSQSGYNSSFGMNVNRWLGVGIDGGLYGGSNRLTFDNTVLKGQVESILNNCTVQPCFPAPAVLPVLSTLYAPTNLSTQTLAIGPQFNLRRAKESTLFVRPGLGIIHEQANINQASVQEQATRLCEFPRGAFCASQEGMEILKTLSQVAANPSMSDTVWFYGVGGGFDVNFTKFIGLRFSTDYVRAHLFPNLLTWQNNVRFSIGPTWRFGNITTPLRQPKEPKQPKQPKQ